MLSSVRGKSITTGCYLTSLQHYLKLPLLSHFLQIKCKETVKDIEEVCDFLKGSSLQEAERRTSKYFSSRLATELSLLFKGTKGPTRKEGGRVVHRFV